MQGQSYLLAVGIQVDQQLQDQAAGNLQHLEEVAQGRVYPCLPLVVLPSVGLPLAYLSGGTVVETSGVACWVTAVLEASVAGPLLEEGPSGKAAGLQSLVQQEGSAWGPGLQNINRGFGEYMLDVIFLIRWYKSVNSKLTIVAQVHSTHLISELLPWRWSRRGHAVVC